MGPPLAQELDNKVLPLTAARGESADGRVKEERSDHGSLLSVPLTPQVTLDKQGAQPWGGSL